MPQGNWGTDEPAPSSRHTHQDRTVQIGSPLPPERRAKSVLQLSCLSMSHFLNVRNYSWFNDSTYYYWSVPTNCINFDWGEKTKGRCINRAWMVTHYLIYLSFTGDIYICNFFLFLSKASYYLHSKQKQNANLLRGDKGTAAIRR